MAATQGTLLAPAGPMKPSKHSPHVLSTEKQGRRFWAEQDPAGMLSHLPALARAERADNTCFAADVSLLAKASCNWAVAKEEREDSESPPSVTTTAADVLPCAPKTSCATLTAVTVLGTGLVSATPIASLAATDESVEGLLMRIESTAGLVR